MTSNTPTTNNHPDKEANVKSFEDVTFHLGQIKSAMAALSEQLDKTRRKLEKIESHLTSIEVAVQRKVIDK